MPEAFWPRRGRVCPWPAFNIQTVFAQQGRRRSKVLHLAIIINIWRKKVYGVRRGNKFVITAKRRRRDKTKSSQNQVSKRRQSKGGGSEKKVTLDSKEI